MELSDIHFEMVLTRYVLGKIPQSINMSALFNIALYQIESACLVEYAQGIIWLMFKYHKWIVRLNGCTLNNLSFRFLGY